MLRRLGFFRFLIRLGAVLLRSLLAFHQLLRRESGFNLCHLFMSPAVPLLRGEQIPGISFHLILLYPVTLAMHRAEHIIGVDTALFRGFAKPVHGLLAVLRQMIPAVEHRAQGHLSIH